MVSQRQTEANKAHSHQAVSTKIHESKKAVLYRQTHTQITRIQLNIRKWQANKKPK